MYTRQIRDNSDMKSLYNTLILNYTAVYTGRIVLNQMYHLHSSNKNTTKLMITGLKGKKRK